jgi:hypothetical protein
MAAAEQAVVRGQQQGEAAAWGLEEDLASVPSQLAQGAGSILPLTVNVADPSPGLGWLGRERLALTERGRPRLTLCLALVHHLSLTANVPLREIVDWLHGLGTSVVIEFIDREDEMARLLISRRKPDSAAGYSRDLFERCLYEAFEVERTEALCEGRRGLYFAHPKSPPRTPR